MGKDSFILYKLQCKSLIKMSDKQLGRFFRAIIKYQLGEVVEVEEDIEILFDLFKNQFDIDDSKYNVIVERNRINGRKGGAPKKVKDESADCDEEITQSNPNNPLGSKITQKSRYDNDNDNEVKKEISTNVDIKKESPNGLMSPVGDASSVNYQKMVVFFNSEVEKHKSIIPKINDIKNKRKDAVNARVREYGKEALIKAIEKAVSSPFLNGKNSRSFIASFDWIMKPNNFPKVLEGNYDEKMVEYGNNRTVNSEENRRQRQLDAFGIISRLAEEDGGGSVNIR